MEVRTHYSIFALRRELEVTLESGELLNETKALWLESESHATFVPLVGMVRDQDKVTLRYDIGGLRSLRSSLLRSRSPQMLVRMLAELMRAIASCVQVGNDYRSMLFDSKTVFVCRDGSLRFIYVPTDRVRFRSHNSPISFLTYIAEPKLRWPRDLGRDDLEKKIACYVAESSHVFSYGEFRNFMVHEVLPREQFSQLGGADARELIVPEVYLYSLPGSLGQRTRVVSISSEEDARGKGDALGLRRVSDCSEHLLPTKGLLTIGRAEGCDIRLNGNGTVSRVHAELEVSDGGVRVRDLESTNGTRVRGEQVEPGVWQSVDVGDELSFATARFQLTYA